MNNSNKVGVDNDSETVTSNTTQSKKLCEYLKKRKGMWITFTIIVLSIIITIPIVIIKTKETNDTNTTTTEIIVTTKTTQTIKKEPNTTSPSATRTSTPEPTTASTSTTTSTLTTRTPGSKSNLLINGDAETGPCKPVSDDAPPTGWNHLGSITQMIYNNTNVEHYFTDPGPSDRGNCFFYGDASDKTNMWQQVVMTSMVNADLIDSHTVYFLFSAWLGGWKHQNDTAEVSLTFYGHMNQIVGSTVTVGPVTNTDRADITSLLYREANGLVPVGARSFVVSVAIRVFESGGANDGCVDNIAVYLHQ
ncbi:unnamed protein product [Adineta steineri]|uniref:Uncharacterized protein n=1 Tax=Adineta steineri TaxID=433720 RepID=A0A814YIT7_9BILA|nr:unnamed protein product [Adineta steineri]CAF1231316.1 unnamed protein product [Adineta steineri]